MTDPFGHPEQADVGDQADEHDQADAPTTPTLESRIAVLEDDRERIWEALDGGATEKIIRE